MWWLERSKIGGRPFKAAAALVMAGLFGIGAGGCGFHPLYGPTASGADLSQVMKTVAVATIPSRPGQRLRNELICGTTGGGEALSPVYRLDVVLRETTRNALVTQAGLSTGAVVQLDAEFRLVRIKDNAVVFKGYGTAQAPYDLVGTTGIAGSTYSDVRAGINAEDRAARSLADTIKTRLAAYLSGAA